MKTSPAFGEHPNVAIIGVGSMGGAILAGLSKTPRNITVTTQTSASAAKLRDRVPENVTVFATEDVAGANRNAVRGSGVVLLAVKPWMIHEVLQDIAADLEPDAIVVSVAAGVTIASMQAHLPDTVTVMRAMPNTPSVVGLGVTGLAAGRAGSGRAGASGAIETVTEMFATVGKVLVVDESRIDALAAVSGSGPAYLYLYVEEMTAAAERLGFSAEDARLLAENTVIGAAELLRVSGETPQQLRRNVTSPKGTTEQAIRVLQQANLGAVFDEALAANMRRSAELAAGA